MSRSKHIYGSILVSVALALVAVRADAASTPSTDSDTLRKALAAQTGRIETLALQLKKATADLPPVLTLGAVATPTPAPAQPAAGAAPAATAPGIAGVVTLEEGQLAALEQQYAAELLPLIEQIASLKAQRAQIAATVASMGNDCPGALQFCQQQIDGFGFTARVIEQILPDCDTDDSGARCQLVLGQAKRDNQRLTDDLSRCEQARTSVLEQIDQARAQELACVQSSHLCGR